MSFAAVTVKSGWIDGHLILARRIEHPRFRKIETFSPRNHLHALRLTVPEDVDVKLRAWTAEAYEVGLQRHHSRK